jgi:outer membrane protein assembly factor BamB
MRRSFLFALIVFSGAVASHAEDWPQWRGPSRDGIWSESGIRTELDEEQLTPLWTVPIGSGYCGPTVAEGRVYVMDRILDPERIERILCFNSTTGEAIWDYEYESEYKRVGYTAGPRASVLIHEGLAYALGTMGHLHCLDAASGELIWKRDLQEEYEIDIPIWGVSASPIIEGDLLILQAGVLEGGCVMTFNRLTGEEVWRSVDGRSSYSAPIVVDWAEKRLLIVWAGERVVGLNPATGRVYWEHPTPPYKMVINVPTPVLDGDLLFITGFYDGSWMLRLTTGELNQPDAELVWRRRGESERETDGLHCMMSTPILQDGYIYGFDSYGELRCLEAETGDRIWEDLNAAPEERWGNVHMVQNGDDVWMFNERGELILARISPEGYEERGRAKLIDPTPEQLTPRRPVCWSHPAYADRCVFIRNDRELVCASLAAPEPVPSPPGEIEPRGLGRRIRER